MEIYSSPVSAMKNGKSLDEIHKSATFHPSIWGDFFLKYDSDNTKITDAEQEELAKHKEMVREMLSQTPHDSTRKLELIDEIQRLGVGYHFEKEIEESLKYIHDSYMQQNSKDSDDLRTVALRFRLLRQQGYNVPCGNYAASLQNDVEGLLNLYEAAHLLTHDEGILDNAIEFCWSRLHASLHKLADVSLSKRVSEALEMPNRWSLTRLGARKLISAYQENESRNETLLNFAKLDFNQMQKMHQRELSEATRWWKKLGVANKMPHARDRIAELYLWVLGVFFEPCYAKARTILLKCISMASIADDTYEYATIDELRILTDAIQRWDANEDLEDSPPYIQMLYRSLIKTYTEIEDEMEKSGESYRVQYAKQEMKKLLQSYFDEVKWLYNDNYIPTLEEYLKVSVVSGGYMMLSTTSLVARLLDDLVGDEYEEKPSSIHCYMRQYGMSEDDARAQIKQRMKNAWKDMNQECLEPTPASMPILMRVINLARAAQLIYSNGDCYTDPNKAKEWVKMLLIEVVP
ncbi:Bicyclo-germacrene synthase [Salvia divinorum]|uniref:Bicyclo-germacrene synthase n=1 Tax=Salvia divinorum TaxID=28513 RepID=A0ABD1HU80_SALDI